MAGSGLDSWQDLVSTCNRLELEVSQSLSSSRGSSFNSQTEWRQKVEESLERLALAVLSLKQKLTASKNNLTAGELRRREAITVGLEGREKQLRLAFQQQRQTGMKQSESEEEQRRKLLNSSIVNIGMVFTDFFPQMKVVKKTLCFHEIFSSNESCQNNQFSK